MKKISKIDIEIADEFKKVVKSKEICRIVSDTLEKFTVDNYLIEINFVSEKSIWDLNNKYRNIDKATDVLSFPMENPSGTSLRFLGSIVISPSIVALKSENMEEVVKHGILHLLGYDHEDNLKLWDEQAKKINCNL